MHIPLLKQPIHLSQRILASSPGSEAITVLCKLPFEDRLDHFPQRRLYRPVTYRRNTQRTLVHTSRLGYVDPPDRLRPVAPVLPALVELHVLALAALGKR